MIQRISSFLLLLSTALYAPASAAPPVRADADKVTLTAWLQAGSGRMDDIIVEVEVNGTKDWGRPDAEGRVELLLPADEVALIHFKKPGHLTKSVLVDTHNLHAGPYKGKHRRIEFGVEMNPGKDAPGQVFAGPVGRIAFSAGAGELSVGTDHRMVPATRKQSIVF